ALRRGSGLVRIALPAGIVPIVASANPCYMTAPLPEDAHGRLATAAEAELVSLVRANTVAALGPGLGQSADLANLILSVLEQTTTPLVLDADALNVLAPHLDRVPKQPGRLILTPHPGEFSRLSG